ncbi:MAG: TonB-dependent receptor, partial [Brevundimonas sp.]
DVILDDAVASTNFKTESCVGTNLPVSGRQCIDMNFADPRVLRGDLTAEERAFLFDTETGNTLYEQTYVEGTIGGNLFELPAGPLGLALGFHIRRDEINDTPGDVTLADNSWGLSGAGITEGSEDTREAYVELAVPLLKDYPFIQDLDLSLSGRHTDTKTSGDASTYKVGLNWAVNDAVRFRATHGTSFRAPALFELYLADQTSFAGQRNIDPCLNLDNRLADGTVTQKLYDNCTNAAGPGGGVAGDFTGGNSSAEVVTGGGLGVLTPETSKATVVGVIITPPNTGISLAVDYFDININNQVTNLGAGGILTACYLSDNFPTDPICNQFDRDPTLGITQVRDSFINIAEQTNRGLDFTARFVTETPWGELTIDSQTTWTLENFTAVFADSSVDPLGEVGYPELVGN